MKSRFTSVFTVLFTLRGSGVVVFTELLSDTLLLRKIRLHTGGVALTMRPSNKAVRLCSIESFPSQRPLGSPEYMTLIFIIGVVFSVLAGAMVKCAVEKTISTKTRPRCGRGQCGELGWSSVRKDSEACHAVCLKCGWISHFNVKQQQVD